MYFIIKLFQWLEDLIEEFWHKLNKKMGGKLHLRKKGMKTQKDRHKNSGTSDTRQDT